LFSSALLRVEPRM